MGRPKVFDTPDRFGKVITDFIKYCKDNNIFPSDYQLRIYSGIPYSTLYNYCTGGKGSDDEDRYKPYLNEYKKLIEFREDFILNVQGKRDSFAIFLLKQQKNGGYSDAPQLDITAKELTVKTSGIGDKAFD